VPFDGLGRGIAIKLITDIDEMLYAGDIDIVDRGEVENDGFESWLVVGVVLFVTRAWARVIPWAVLLSSKHHFAVNKVWSNLHQDGRR
jgi:hypothetical protein